MESLLFNQYNYEMTETFEHCSCVPWSSLTYNPLYNKKGYGHPPFSQDFCIRITFGMLNDRGMTISHQAVPPSDPSRGHHLACSRLWIMFPDVSQETSHQGPIFTIYIYIYICVCVWLSYLFQQICESYIQLSYIVICVIVVYFELS
jgi:hypothetical protein